MDPDEIEFLNEKKSVIILPLFNGEAMHLISGDIGPFRETIPCRVPLWMALNLKNQNKCKIVPPEWMSVKLLEDTRDLEMTSSSFTKMPCEYYPIESKVLLDHASEDISNYEEIRTIVKDIWDIRMAKLRTAVNALVTSTGSYASVDYLTGLEMNVIRPILFHSLDQIYRMKNTNKHQMEMSSTIMSSSFNMSTPNLSR